MKENVNSAMETALTILLLEEDDEAQRGLKRNLRAHGYRVLLVVEMQDALDWMSSGSIHADLVLVDIVCKSPEEALEIGCKLRDLAGYNRHTPLVVMAETFPPELEGTDRNAGGNDWICYLEDSEQLHRLLHHLTVRKAA